VWAFFGNAAFLQTIAVPAYGSNAPLWSLAYEAWYYALAGLAAVVMTSGSSTVRLAAGAAAAASIVLLPVHLSMLGLVWIAGAVARLATARLGLAGATVLAVSALMAGTLSIAISRHALFVTSSLAADIGLGLVAAAVLPALVRLPVSAHGLYARTAMGLSEISYTLYATHFPMLAFVWFVMLAPLQAQPSWAALALLAALLAMVLSLACGMWWMFERNTPLVRGAINEALARLPRRAAVAEPIGPRD
jgi:peptidoglycan/LPS O-acetylase OafA/YrhL